MWSYVPIRNKGITTHITQEAQLYVDMMPRKNEALRFLIVYYNKLDTD